MLRISRIGIGVITVLVAWAGCFAVIDAHAGPFDKLKKKVEKKAAERTDKAADNTVEKAADSAEGAVSGTETEEGGASGKGKSGNATSGAAAAGEAARGASASGSKVSSVSTKFDYVPGDRVLFIDDFTQDELGEFPARWTLTWGNFEIAESEGERWLQCVSPDGRVRMKLPMTGPLPEYWTLEFDYYGETSGSPLSVRALAPGDQQVWEATFPSGGAMTFRTGEIYSSTPYEGGDASGRHHIMVMARGTAVKMYVDQQRMVSVPEVLDKHGKPITIEIRLWATTKPRIANVRFAEGCRPPKDMLAEGKLVTYGIRFETGSDVVQADSAPVLRQISGYLESNPAVKLEIIGHTDNVGSAANNLDLSKRRAAAVANVLSSEFKIAGDRFQADGKGDTQPVAGNTKPEGRAMNRRVEFIKH